jgi:FG-GAP-like repeat/Abnormal spindle-like microcephaly-assoc'd, ASPM-SPD-2-Hydin
MPFNRTWIVFAAAFVLALALPSMASALSFQETSQSPLPGLTGVADIATGDFNGDGDADMAVAAEEGVVIWISDGDGTFTEGQTLTIDPQVNATANSVVTGDFNGDGNVDLAYSDGPYKVYIALGNGDGTFVAPSAPTKFNTPFSLGAGLLQAADFNGDGDTDLALAGGVHSQFYEETGYQIFLSDGDGTFTAESQVTVSAPVNSSVVGLTVGDFTNDGNLDLALLVQPFESSSYTDNEILGEEGQGDGTFVAAAANPISLGFTGPAYAYAAAAGDIDGSGGDDLVVTVSEGPSTVPLLGSSTDFLSLDAAGGVTDLGLPNSVATADVDGDGRDDAITAFFGAQSVGVALGSASGALAAAPGSPYPIAQSNFFSSSVAAGDFNGDGYPDIAVASNAYTNGGPLTQGVAVLINSPQLGVGPSASDFGDTNVGATETRTVTLSGLGAPGTEVSQIALAGGPGSPFSVVDPGACESLAYGEECEVEVEFSPTAAGKAKDTLEITSDSGPAGADSVSTVALTGTGLAPQVEVLPGAEDFGSVEVGGAPVTKAIAIRSSGGAPLTVTGISLSAGADFTLADPSACIGSAAKGTSCKLSLSFAPTPGAAGLRSAVLTVVTDAGTRTVQLSGTAVLPTVAPPARSNPTNSPPPDTTGTPAAPPASPEAKLRLRSRATVAAGKEVKLKVRLVNTGNTPISNLTLTTKGSKSLLKLPKPVTIPSLPAGQTVTRTIVVELKSAATEGSSLRLTVSAAAGGSKLASGAVTVKVM